VPERFTVDGQGFRGFHILLVPYRPLVLQQTYATCKGLISLAENHDAKLTLCAT
jgi:hypothetical protein